MNFQNFRDEKLSHLPFRMGSYGNRSFYWGLAITGVVVIYALFVDENFFPHRVFGLFSLIPLIIVFLLSTSIAHAVGGKDRKRFQTDLGNELVSLQQRIFAVTTPSIPGHEVVRSFGIVRGIAPDSAGSDAEFQIAEQEALLEILRAADRLGANAVVDLKLVIGSYETQGSKWMSARPMYSGTAVVIK